MTHVWLLLSMACVDETAIAEEMERGIEAAHEAQAVGLVAAEVFRWAHAPATVTLRHGSDCGCPCRERVDGSDSFTVLADYAELGCFPDSNVLPFPVQGHITLVGDGDDISSRLDDVRLEDRVDVSGSPSARMPFPGSSAAVSGPLTVGDMTAELDLTVRYEPDALRLDGTASVPSGDVRLIDVRVRLEDVFGPCATPSEGRAVVGADKGDIEVSLGLGEGMVEATYRDRTSSSVPFCPYRPDWW